MRLKRKEKSYIVLGFSSKTRPPREAGNEEKIRKGPWEAIKKELKRQKDSRKAFSDFFKVWSRKKYKIQKILQKSLKATLKGPSKHVKIIEKTNPPILNFECLFLIKTTCFTGVNLEKGHSVREWGHFPKESFCFSFGFS